jgi:3-dehydroquinate dehydratase-2|tara:strand:- start:541 stop:978 length:438 start_codon:yes stop_codon:yes gene_type:complete
MALKNIFVMHGPNLNLLGEREPKYYGSESLADINNQINEEAKKLKLTVEIKQSNSELEIIELIQHTKTDFLIINPAAFTHTSVAIRDAIAAIKIPFIEVHLSNVFARESFRKESFFSDLAVGVISGLGSEGYLAAMRYAVNQKNL